MFIGVDGEGFTLPDGTHRYTILSIGNNTLADPDGNQLTASAIFQFLWENYLDNPESTYIGFYLGYDFTQWFRTLPESRGYYLCSKSGIAKRIRRGANPTPFPVRYNDWEFDILGSVRFRMRHRSDKRWMYIGDVGNYFQSSFLNVIDPSKWTEKICSDSEYAIVSEGKAVRVDVQTPSQWVLQYPSTIKYNHLENEILARVMDRMAGGLHTEGVKLNRDQWFGPGQAAQRWLTNVGLLTSKESAAVVPPDVAEAARASYYGGWFEIFAHGHLPGPTYEYDINSAYPAAMTALPCLRHGTWGLTGDQLGLVHARVAGSNPIAGVAPCRRRNGTIARPLVAEGWYWEHELAAAHAAGLLDTWEVQDRWGYRTGCENTNCIPLNAAIPAIYQRRLQTGKNTPHGKALKIIYNSAYGKMAQSVGTPKFANPIYASLITSHARTQILNAIASHPTKASSLVMVATDGIYFREPHPTLDIHPERLGAWDAKEKQNLTLFMPGVYWDDTSRARIAAGQTPALKSRGINAKDLTSNIARIDGTFHQDEWWKCGEWPQFDITLGFNMVSAKLAITRGAWNTAGQIAWRNDQPHSPQIRTISSNPDAKRSSQPRYSDHNGDIRLSPYPLATPDGRSVPYDGTFGMVTEECGISPDGECIDLIAQAILGE